MEHEITISEGEGNIHLISGNYSATGEAEGGYDNTTFTPLSVEITNEINEYEFTVSASGMLMIYAYDGESGQGHQIEGATFYRCSSDGTKYGNAVVTNSSGFAYLTNLPHSSSHPTTVYFVQTASDGSHSFSEDIREAILTIDVGNSILVENPKIT